MTFRSLALTTGALAGLLLATSALAPDASAQTAPPMRIRGTITALDGNVLSVTSREGLPLKINLRDEVGVSVPKKLDLSAIGPNSYIGTAALPQPDGTLRAQEVVVFPETARGTGEGQYPWDLSAGSSMTNANVAAVVSGTNGRELSLTYKGGTAKLVIPPDAPIVTFVPATRADLKPGMKVFLAATKAADGALSAARVTVEKDGVAPPI